eukprot:5578899-Alexandrium_andersonii.AAC.1
MPQGHTLARESAPRRTVPPGITSRARSSRPPRRPPERARPGQRPRAPRVRTARAGNQARAATASGSDGPRDDPAARPSRPRTPA